ncbi:MAG: RDD family protein [Actinomyces urogenitalis]|uniref:RDD family protein n=3 Tax=Actinomyces urogenitalis TaxID=103621 RepID=C0W8G7_9ACTO|nr:RDD family protein [Actinomyces urogenitalis]ETJ04144.1 MAG: RDD protein [Actinomyces urogenitalis DORA_12]EEH64981.1 RDD family protein [Actinomyces urogenitalis DSM 15434]KGF01295.1 transporter [Actinomyces urogenitalis S6-C4]MBS5976459.1 RDD family protein [Actinomyces urogenitalis]MBS6072309.1 RDD family protein [Actinomyces urogenitalis]
MTWLSDTSSERMMVPERVVIGEAVALEVTAASVGARILSGLIDYALYTLGGIVTLLLWLTLYVRLGEPGSAGSGVLVSLVVLCWMVVVPVAVETLSRGRSAGRMVTGTRVVRDDGGAVRFRHALVRALTAVIEIWATSGGIAIASCIVTRRGKRLGDLLAGTYVLTVRSGALSAPPLLMPPELAQWAAQADMRALPGTLALAARTFLQRASTLAPQARARVGQELAAQVSQYVTVPPTGTHPERFLAAVLCERRDRELEMALGDRALEERELERSQRLPYGVV